MNDTQLLDRVREALDDIARDVSDTPPTLRTTWTAERNLRPLLASAAAVATLAGGIAIAVAVTDSPTGTSTGTAASTPIPSASTGVPTVASTHAPSTAQTTEIAPPRTEPIPTSPHVPTASCVATFTPELLAQRSFAFDGTIIAAEPLAPGYTDPPRDGEVLVTFEVHEWFRGGNATTATVTFLGPNTSVEIVPVVIGDRLLVTGEPRFGGDPLSDPVAWGCGFTQPFTPDVAATWRSAFSG